MFRVWLKVSASHFSLTNVVGAALILLNHYYLRKYVRPLYEHPGIWSLGSKRQQYSRSLVAEQ